MSLETLIPTDPHTRDFVALRDRAAYIHITGTLPTHLRDRTNTWLAAITQTTVQPTSLDRSYGSVKVIDEMVYRLRLNEHPMVKSVQAKLGEGHRIALSKTPRRGYSRVHMDDPSSGKSYIVKIDGSICSNLI